VGRSYCAKLALMDRPRNPRLPSYVDQSSSLHHHHHHGDIDVGDLNLGHKAPSKDGPIGSSHVPISERKFVDIDDATSLHVDYSELEAVPAELITQCLQQVPILRTSTPSDASRWAEGLVASLLTKHNLLQRVVWLNENYEVGLPYDLTGRDEEGLFLFFPNIQMMSYIFHLNEIKYMHNMEQTGTSGNYNGPELTASLDVRFHDVFLYGTLSFSWVHSFSILCSQLLVTHCNDTFRAGQSSHQSMKISCFRRNKDGSQHKLLLFF
jgi:hypothetical protein